MVDNEMIHADRATVVAGLAGATVALLAGEDITSARHGVAALAAGAGISIFLVPWAAEAAGVTSHATIAALAFFGGLTGLQTVKLAMRYGPRALVVTIAGRLGVTLGDEGKPQ